MSQIPPEELEPSLTALLLGELPHEQAAALHQRLAQDPELAQLYERLKHTLALVRETVANPAAPTVAQPAPLKLDARRRSALLQEFKTVRPPELARPRTTPILLAVAAGLVIVGLLASMLLPALSRGKYQADSVALLSVGPPTAAQPSHEESAILQEARPTTPPQVVAAPAAPPAFTEMNRIVLPSTTEATEAGTPAGAKDASPPPLGAPGTYEGGRVASASPATHSGPSQDKAGVSFKLDPRAEAEGSKLAGLATDSDKRPAPALGDVASLFRLFKSEPALGTDLRQPSAKAGEPAAPAATAGDGYLAYAPQVTTFSGRAPSQGVVHSKQGNVGLLEGDVGGLPSVSPQTPGQSSAGSMVFYDAPRQWNFGAGNAKQPPSGTPQEGSVAPVTNYIAINGVIQGAKGFELANADPQDVQAALRDILGNASAPAFAGAGSGSSGTQKASEIKTVIADFSFQQSVGGLSSFGLAPAQKQPAAESPQATPLSGEAEELKRASKPDLEKAAKSRPYLEAKNKLDDLTRFDQALRMKLAAEKTDLQIPKSTMVEVVEKAAPGDKPSTWESIRAGFGGTVERSARVRVERDQTDIPGMQSPSSPQSYDPYFIQTESELIRSEEVLGKVVKKLNLEQAWAKHPASGEKLSEQEALRLLRGKLRVNAPSNTNLLSIGARADDPAEAAKLANAVADAYTSYREQNRQKLASAGVNALEHALVDEQQKTRVAQAEVDRLRELAETEAQRSQTNTLVHTGKGRDEDLKALSRPKPSASAPIPQPEVLACDNAFSTFSLNVSDVSFKLAAASLEKGVLPDFASIRSEEFINTFDYRDPEAPPGVPVAFAWERASYPFAQNRDLLRFSLKTAAAGREAGRPMNIVLLLDNSGSMERADRVRIIQEALRVLAAQLQPQDKFSVVTFARTARLRIDGIPGDQAAQAAKDIAGLTPEGGTNLEDAMNLAYQTALRHYLPGGINRVVLLTDGAANLGEVEPDSLKQKVEANRQQGVALDCFGIGWEGYNDDLLETLSRNGDGRYGFINTPEEASTSFAAQLAGALHVAAADVKVQVEFNPKRVTAYRQIGYARHQLTKEQFRDNTVDAAELGAAESGNALYVVEANPHGEGPLATVRVRYKVPATTDYREQEWTVPYTGNAVALDQASPALRLAASASAFSEWLAASPYAADVTPDGLLGYLNGVPEVYGADGRPRKLEWMVRQAKSIAGK